MKWEHSQARSQSGLTLLEIIVVLGVLVVALLSFLGVLVASNNLRGDSESSYRIHILAANRLEALKLEGNTVADLLAGYPGGTATYSIDPALLRGLSVTNVSGRINIEPVTPSSVTLRVQIAYVDAKGESRLESVSTVVNKESP